MKKELHPLIRLARKAVESYIEQKKTPRLDELIASDDLTPEMKERAGVFVSIKKFGELRGCIGTFEPTRKNVAEEVINNAISSATQDPRFPSVNTTELPKLSYSVDILTKPEPIKDQSQLDPKRYGVIVESGGRRGLLLPNLEGVATIEQQIDICRHKAGISHHDPIKLYRFEVKRFSSEQI
jgi:AmmeMemoRadiSam system protein A